MAVRQKGGQRNGKEEHKGPETGVCHSTSHSIKPAGGLSSEKPYELQRSENWVLPCGMGYDRFAGRLYGPGVRVNGDGCEVHKDDYLFCFVSLGRELPVLRKRFKRHHTLEEDCIFGVNGRKEVVA